MTQDEIAGSILDGLYDRRAHTGVPSMNDIAREKGIDNVKAAGRASSHVKDLGLVEHSVATLAGQNATTIISPLGVHFHEQHRNGDGVLKALRGGPPQGAGPTYLGPVFQGDVSRSKIAIALPSEESPVRLQRIADTRF